MLWQDIIEIGSVAMGLIAVVAVWRGVMKPLRKMHYFLDDWFGTPARPGVPPRLGVMARLDAIEHELHPNGSLSMRDAIDRIERATSSPQAPITVQVAAAPASMPFTDGEQPQQGS